jgi:hypothetical protein
VRVELSLGPHALFPPPLSSSERGPTPRADGVNVSGQAAWQLR